MNWIPSSAMAMFQGPLHNTVLPLLVAAILFPIAAVIVAGLVWLIVRRRRVPGAWASIFRAHGPLLVGAHLLIFTAALFGTRLAANAFYNVGFAYIGIPSYIYSEWAMDFWLGPFAVVVACIGLIVLVVTTISARWAQWRGDIVLAAGVFIASAVFLFCISKVEETSTADAAQHFKITQTENGIETVSTTAGIVVARHRQNGLLLVWVPVLLLVACGAALVNYPGVERVWPRFSRSAFWGLIGPAGVFLVVIGVTLFARLRLEEGPSAAAFCLIVCPIAMTILGAFAVRQIKRSGGKLYGLRLAAVEALLLLWIAVPFLVSAGVFWGVVGLLTWMAPKQIPWPNNGPPEGPVVVALTVIAIVAALATDFFVGRALWRAVVRRRPEPESSNRAPAAVDALA